MCRKKREQKLPEQENTIYTGFVRRSSTVISATEVKGEDFDELKAQLFQKMQELHHPGEDIYYTIVGDKQGQWHGHIDKKGDYEELSNSTPPWYLWIIFFPIAAISWVYLTIYYWICPKALDRDRKQMGIND
ncbi:hypothetical protein [Porphyromonas uenonis]|uniref:hypothetical protein n=1 Tax=Porphyromonas uenonis TaxID=281920 RepID=UPI0026EE2ADB|nr:hypothetical protein [Porphyromonas uenonis]